MADSDDLSRLSCSRCKARKVRCNRALPICGRCQTHGIECVYPERVKRRTLKQISETSKGSRSSDEALTAILERLRRVEDKCTSLPQSQSPGASVNSWTDQAQSCSTTPIPTHVGLTSTSATPSGHVPSASSWTTPDVPSPTADLDVATILKSSIDDVQKQVLRQAAKSALSDVIHIPKDLAKTWVQAYFHYRLPEMFVSLIDRRLIELMPELTEMEHVHVDAAITLIYYTVLYHGCGIVASTQSPDNIRYYKAAYVCCLRALPAWQRETTGSTTDLIAALSMALVCADSFDYDLGWEMYKYVCEYVRRLDLQNLDADVRSNASISNELRRPISDDDRKGFWDLVQLDLLFQLVFDKPPSITATSWKVDMPWLRSGSQPEGGGMVATVFVAVSRIALVLMRFFGMLEASKEESREAVMSKTEEYCREVKQLFTDGHLGDWFLDSMASAGSTVESWRIIDVTLTGYICIIFMFRKALGHGPDPLNLPTMVRKLMDLPLAVDAAYNTVRVTVRFLERYAMWPDMANTLFGAFQMHVPYAMIVNAALDAPDVAEYAKEVAMLRQINKAVATLASTEREYTSLVHALGTVDGELRRRGYT